MFTDVDFELYPNDCEVVEISPHNHFYLIQKNGSSSLRKHAVRAKGKVYFNQQIKQLSDIVVLIRDPEQRYISGVSTYVNHLIRDNPHLDKKTCLWVATRYQFLNRHYLPQFLWLVNLARFINDTTVLHLKDFNEIKNLTDIHDPAGPPIDHEIMETIMQRNLNQKWKFIDQILQDNIGEKFTWKELLEVYHKHPKDPLKEIRLQSRALINVLC
jgi:hypothetical protein